MKKPTHLLQELILMVVLMLVVHTSKLKWQDRPADHQTCREVRPQHTLIPTVIQLEGTCSLEMLLLDQLCQAYDICCFGL